MSQPVETGQLSSDRLEQAWPLIREIAGESSLENWRSFAEAMLAPVNPDTFRRGILIAERKRTIRGLVTYETLADLSCGRLLLLRNAVVMDLALAGPIARALYRRSLAVAEDATCEGLCVEVTPQMAWIGDIWSREASEAGGLPVTVVSVRSPLAVSIQSDKIVSVNAG